MEKMRQIRLLMTMTILAGLLFTVIALAAPNGWVTKDGKTYYYENGEKVTGFRELEKDGKTATYYFDTKGVMLTGEQEIEGNVYLFASNGKMLIGWQNEKLSYYRKVGGRVSGFLQINGYYYHFDTK